MSDEFKDILDFLGEKWEYGLKKLENDEKYLEKVLNEITDSHTRILTLMMTKQTIQTQMLYISLQQLGLLIRHTRNSLSLKADKNFVDDLERIRKSMEEKFIEQDSKITETIKPLSDEIKKTLERQERNKELYK